MPNLFAKPGFLSLLVLGLILLASAQEIMIPQVGSGLAGPAQPGMPLPNHQRISQEFNQAVLPMPGFTRWMIGDERIIFNGHYNDGTSSRFGAISQGGLIARIQPEPYQDSTIMITASEMTITRILNSGDPYNEFKRAWGTDIKVEGLGLFQQIRLFFGEVVLQAIFFITPTYQIPSNLTTMNESEAEDEGELVDCMPRTGGPGGEPAKFSPEERGRFTNVTENITLLQQPNKSTCSPTSGAIDLLHWNATVAPGLVNMSEKALIDDMAKRMNTTDTGTLGNNIAYGLVAYLKDHGASGKFTVKVYRRGNSWSSSVKKGVTFIKTDDIINDLKEESTAGENLIVDVQFPDTTHSMKLVALNNNADANGEHLAAFADPARGGIVYAGISGSGQVSIQDKAPGQIISFIAVSPKK